MTELPALLAGMSPRLREGRYVFTVLPDDGPVLAEAVVVVAEDEGRTAVVPWPGPKGAEYECAWITLEVASSLAAVGFLAVVCAALAGAGISVNPVSGFHHDHLFVPWERRDDAMAVLAGVSAGGSRGSSGS
ncbi:ACT domain-containing protein [Actinomycetospora sp. OC33-EN08]|uniref:ACT domain-containing protein n=1 Tax=Actinomycetospora aurantiaca TaxID=3129233 RepID=A0ABU8MQM3_9PSEU